MNNLVPLYTSLDGRIGRKTWWLASIGLAVVVLIIEFVILTPLGFGPMPAMSAADPGAIAATIHRSQWVSLIVYIIVGLPILALGVKRRHDKDNNGLDVMIFYGIALLINLAGALGFGYADTDLGNGMILPMPTMPLTIVNILFGIYSVYLLVVLGFLKGTTGPNQYGPDPLLGGRPVAA
jgi:uncharacterized membrane protein YhaH (DUF805 family)